MGGEPIKPLGLTAQMHQHHQQRRDVAPCQCLIK